MRLRLEVEKLGIHVGFVRNVNIESMSVRSLTTLAFSSLSLGRDFFNALVMEMLTLILP